MASLTRALLFGLVIGLIGTIIAFTPFGQALEEDVGLDQLFMLRGQRPAPTDVVIVSIDKESANELGLAKEPVKWPRTLHAQLIDRLTARGARVIGFDVLFKEQHSAEENRQLAHSIQAANNVVLFEYLDKQLVPMAGQTLLSDDQSFIEILVPPLPILADAALALAPFALPKVPAKVSQIWLFKPSAGDVPTLPAVMFQIYAFEVYDEFRELLINVDNGAADILPEDKQVIFNSHNVEEILVKLRTLFKNNPAIASGMLQHLNTSADTDTRTATLLRALIKLYQGRDSRYLNYYGPARSLNTIAFSTVVNLPEQPGTDESAFDFNGKAVFIGLSEPIQLERVDTFYTPFSQENGVDISGIEIGATVFANMLEDMSIRPLTAPAFILLLIGWGILIGLIGRLLSTALSIASFMLFAGGYLALSFYVFNSSALWLPTVIPLLIQMPVALFAAVLWRYIDTNKERKKIRQAFGYFLPDNIVDDLAHNLSLGKSSQQLNIGTCMATDAEKYTELSENMTPNALGKLMNRYYEILFLPVKQHKGFVSDIVGDAMMAIWTSPQSDREHRRRACAAAVDMTINLQPFDPSSEHAGLPTRIGLHSGEILLGNIGAVNHYEYRAVGDTVNTASRIQGLNKQLGTRLLVSEDVIDDLDEFLTRKLGAFLLVGKSKPTVIYELLNTRRNASVKQKSLCKDFARAYELFQNQAWAEANEKFNQVTLKYNDGPSQYYIGLCKKYIDHPPASPWNNVIIVDKK